MITPKKSLGQNFLVNPKIIEKIIKAAEINSNDKVLEIGPGTGNLTKELVKVAGTVIAVEKDHRFIEILKSQFKILKVFEADILKFNPASYQLQASGYKVVGNIPYYITSHLLRTIFEKWPQPKLIVLTVQKEVAQRIVAKPGEMSLLALSVQLYSDPEIISYVSKGNFRPVPKVDSAILKLTPNPKADTETIKKVLVLAKRAFAGKRKQLKNTLPEIDFKKLDISEKARPEDLSLNEWINMA